MSLGTRREIKLLYIRMLGGLDGGLNVASWETDSDRNQTCISLHIGRVG